MVSSMDLYLQDVVSCMRSKIHLDIVPLAQAINFHANLLDNSCCHNWGIVGCSKKSLSIDLNSMQPQEKIDFAYSCIELIEHQPSEISDLQKFCWLCYHCHWYFMHLANPVRKNHADLQTTISPVYIRQFKLLTNQCFDILANELNYHVAKQQVELILQDKIFLIDSK